MPTYSRYTDQQLTARFAKSDEHAFVEIYQRYKGGIYQLIKKFVHSAQFADDLTQEVFVKIWQSREKLAEVESIKAYLLTSARNHALNNLKKALRSENAMEVILNDYTDHRNTIEEDILSKEYHAFLERILSELPQRSREIFRLCREQGKTYDQAAELLGISRNAVKNHMVSAMKTLRISVKNELDIPLSLFLAILLKS